MAASTRGSSGGSQSYSGPASAGRRANVVLRTHRHQHPVVLVNNRRVVEAKEYGGSGGDGEAVDVELQRLAIDADFQDYDLSRRGWRLRGRSRGGDWRYRRRTFGVLR